MRKNKFWTRRIPAFAIAAAMVLTMMPQTSLTVLAKGPGNICEQDECTETIGALSEGKEATCEDFGEKKYASCGNSSTPHYYDEEGDLIDLTEYGNSIYNWAKIPKSTTHENITKQNGQPATCDADGWKDYYQCETCNAYFEDEEGNTPIEDLEVWKKDENGGLIKKGHVLEKVSEQAGDCKTPHVPEHWKCETCGKIFSDAEGTQEVADGVEKIDGYAAKVPTAHKAEALIEKYPAVDATCTTDGHKALYLCDNTNGCGIYYTVEGDVVTNLSLANDEAAAAEWYNDGDGKIPAAHKLSFVAYVPATCDEDGIYAHYECSVCHAVFGISGAENSDATDDTKLEAATIASEKDAFVIASEGHDIKEVKKEPTCLAPGHKAYYTCETCRANFKDKAGTEAFADEEKLDGWIKGDGKIESAGTEHDLVEVPEVPATCSKDGVKAYQECSICHRNYDKDDILISNLNTWKTGDGKIESTGTEHDMEDVAGKEASCTTPGYDACHHCKTCDNYYVDEEGTEAIGDATALAAWQETGDGKIDVLAHTWGKKTEANAATCTADGNVEYTLCTKCNTYYETSNGELVDNGNKLENASSAQNEDITAAFKLEATAHKKVTHYNAKESTCSTYGNKEYWYCSSCKGYFDADPTNNKDAVAKTEGRNAFRIDKANKHVKTASSVEKEKPVDATCGHAGNYGIWVCDGCGADITTTDNGTTYVAVDSDNNVIPVETSHTGIITEVEAKVEASCKEAGHEAYYVCPDCEIYYSNIDGAEVNKIGNAEDLATWLADGGAGNIAIDPEAHVNPTLEEIEAKAATCKEAGHEAYYYCADCETYYSNADGTEANKIGNAEALATWLADGGAGNITIDPEAHVNPTLEETEAEVATCTKEGHLAYYYCAECETYYSNADGAEANKIGDADDLETWLAGEGKDPIKAHDYEEIPAVPHTCTEQGTVAYKKCNDCGYRVLDDGNDTEVTDDDQLLAPGFDATGHNWDNFVAGNDPDCVTDGNYPYKKCTKCNIYGRAVDADTMYYDEDGKLVTASTPTGEGIFIAKFDHPDTEHFEYKDATCKDKGNDEYWYCKKCGKYSQDCETYDIEDADAFVFPVDKDAHPASEMIDDYGKVEATCSSYGYSGDTHCNLCGKTWEDGSKRPFATHTYDELVTDEEPTCTTPGSGHHVCSACGESKGDKVEIPVIEHVYDKTEGVVEATCTTDGNKGYTVCSVCGEPETSEEGEVIPATGHQHTKTVGAKAATCGADGYTGYVICLDCGEVVEKGEVIPATGEHFYDEGTVTTEATYTTEGVKTYTCTECGATKTETIDKLVCEHSNKKVYDKKDATCTAEGYTGDTICLDCGEVVEEGEVIPATGEHSYDEGTVTTEATYTTEGVKTYTCTECGATKTETIDKLVCEHSNKKVYDKKDATCTAEGYTGDTVCKDCGTFTEGTVIAKTAHSYKDGKCSVCGAADPDYKEPEPEIPNDYFAENNNMYFYKAADGKVTCLDSEGNNIINGFVSDGKYTYYFQADGTAMQDRLTYHPDGEHVIYFDEEGHEVFNTFHHIKRSIAGEEVDDLCFFDMNGYMYVNVMTYDQAGENIYYVNPNGVIERGNWFKFSDTCVWAGTDKKVGTGYGYANADGTLMINTYTYNWNNDLVYMQGDGHMK